MSKDIIVIYNSQTGFTKKYAQWISEALECECVELNEAGKLNFEQYDAIIFGSWACAGGISKIKWFKNNLNEYYGAAEPPVRCGESHLSGLTEPPHFVY